MERRSGECVRVCVCLVLEEEASVCRERESVCVCVYPLFDEAFVCVCELTCTCGRRFLKRLYCKPEDALLSG